ncbi:uncharacterized protein GGS25DRAFT_37108 [Hypoxylon fragiforme]|uniref:uncharacterized protein n=1 Tax=Hypoxylon fragiforme TaxID=63214 RepID=UPI0020C5D727|nr:uncharacterized protein GGS25DRAFT_37108 [Hypoxylon fragiforme]KAI2614167.1 hypothetical protein GGS25DRAFT_37108 [Hypoxylon fragiforme]
MESSMLSQGRTHLSCGELLADSPAASAETPGSCAAAAAAATAAADADAAAVVEEVELGRDIGSTVAGNGAAVPSSMTDRMGGSAGDAVRVGVGEVIGGRLLSACNNASVEEAVLGEC